MIVIDAMIAAYVRVRDREILKRDKAIAVKDGQLLALTRDVERLSAHLENERMLREKGAYHAGDPPAVGADRMHRMFGTD